MTPILIGRLAPAYDSSFSCASGSSSRLANSGLPGVSGAASSAARAFSSAVATAGRWAEAVGWWEAAVGGAVCGGRGWEEAIVLDGEGRGRGEGIHS